MQSVLKPFGARATAWLNDRFNAARLKLTLVYLLILAALLFVSSSVLYTAFSSRLEHRFSRLPHAPEVIIKSDQLFILRQQDVLQDLYHTLLRVNGILLIVGGLASYWLASLTLQPIKSSYDRQRRFLGDASHELRTPLTILKIDYENALADKAVSAAQRDRLTSHLEEVERMNRLVSDLLTLSRLDEQAADDMRRTVVPLPSVIKNAVERLLPFAARQRVSLQIDIKNEADILGNEEWLLQIMTNVVKNAITYNKPDGRVDITLASEGSMAVVRVADTGIGMAKEHLDKVFDRFYRVDKSRTRQTGGSGLGLSIVQSIVHHLGGTVRIESESGKGTVVTLEFPLA